MSIDTQTVSEVEPNVVERKFTVSEIYGDVVQGEGTMTYVRTHFLRMGGCDYQHCSWCDSLYAVLPEEVRKLERLSAKEIVTRILSLPRAPYVTISGGNPVMHKLDDVVDALHAANYCVAVETQGTLWKDWVGQCECITCSPKPPSSGMTTNWSLLDNFIAKSRLANTQLCLKVVVFTDDDYEYARTVYHRYRCDDGSTPFYLQTGTILPTTENPNGDTVYTLTQRYRELTERVLADGDMQYARPSCQQHVLMYGHKRGI